jgi:hypothetical protein
MRNESQKSWISTLRDHVNEWRKREGWSRETAAQVIVEKFEAMGGPEATGIHFEPKTRDAFERQKVNADRIFRWLDDISKDGNLMPANFGFYILAAMPVDIRHTCVNEENQKLGMFATVNEDVNEHGIDISEICETNIEAAETMKALTIAHANPTPENLERAERQAAKVSARFANLRKRLSGSRLMTGAKAVIGRIVHRKEKVQA